MQLDNSYYSKDRKEHLIRDYFDLHSCEWQINKYTDLSNYYLSWVFSPHQIDYKKF